MKVIITNASLGVPIGTIMDVGEHPPAAWKGKCVPYIDVAKPEPEVTEEEEKPRFDRKRG